MPFAITFGAMAFSTFVFDTIDVATRLGRYLIQELTGMKTLPGAAIATLLTVGAPALILSMAGEGFWIKFWTLFGASNQLPGRADAALGYNVAQAKWQADGLHIGAR